MEDYTRAKDHQLQTLGFREDRYHGKIHIDSIELEELTDGILGLTPLRGVSVELLERRFDIDLPLGPRLQEVELVITPQSMQEVTLTVVGSQGSGKVDLACRIIVPPFGLFETGSKKLVLEWPLGKLVVSMVPGGKCDFTPKFKDSGPHSVSDWLAGLRAANLISSGNAELRVSLEDGRSVLNGTISMPTSSSSYLSVIRVLDALSELRTLAGIVDSPVDLEQAFSDSESIFETVALLRGGNTIRFKTAQYSGSGIALDGQKGLYLSAVRFGGIQTFGLAIPMFFTFRIEGGEMLWEGAIAPHSGTIELLSEPLHESYRHFVARASKLSGYSLRIVGSVSKYCPEAQVAPPLQ
jgi:hypothetical protein